MEPIKQFKCLSDLKQIICELGDVRARPVVRDNHPTLYKEKLGGRYRTVMGIRICDYKFSSDEKWVLPDTQMGLSFSVSWDNLKFVYSMFAKGKKPIDIFWMLSEADVPHGLKFVEDSTNREHYFLTVTEKMLVEKLVTKLKLVSYRLTVIRGGGKII
jgi:hypothetical protein